MRKDCTILPDVIENNLKVIFCGMVVGKTSAEVGGYYANTNNKFWDILDRLDFTKKRIKSCEYKKILEYNLGLTDLVKNRSGVDNKINHRKNDIKILEQTIYDLKPNVLAFNGRKPAEAFLNKKRGKLLWGEQKEKYGKTKIWVLPSTSGQNGMWVKKKHEKIWEDLYQNIKKELK